MAENWIGKQVSIECVDPLGIFQGTIKLANAEKITIVKAFRNGLPVRTHDTEVTISASDIVRMSIIADRLNMINGSSHTQNNQQQQKPLKDNQLNRSLKQRSISNSQVVKPVANTGKLVGNFIPPKVEVRLATSAPNPTNSQPLSEPECSRPIHISSRKQQNGPAFSTPINSIKNDSSVRKKMNRNRQPYDNNQAFGTPVHDIALNEDFDFEKNLALFDKQAVWDEIDQIQQKPDLVRQIASSSSRQGTKNTSRNYRHDENIINGTKPTNCRQIEFLDGKTATQEFVTDTGLIVPTITKAMRFRIVGLAESFGFHSNRQCDMLARGTTEMAMQLLGGARRLMPKNEHQWPTIVVICDEPFNDRQSEVGLSTARQLASHGLKVNVYVKTTTNSDRKSTELELYGATGNEHTCNVNDLSTPDLIVLAVCSNVLPFTLTRWIVDNRSPVLAVDPPIIGVANVPIKCSILPILPVDGIHTERCGQLYLCNLGIPERFYREAGIKYKSPFGNKFVIPLHTETE